MTNFDDGLSLKDETMESRGRYQAIGERTRGFISRLVEDGAEAREISYTLAYIATEFGLYITKNSYTVLPTILGGINDASDCAMEHEKELPVEQEQRVPDNVIQLPDGKVVH
jgi:hypothetical protein